jgi:hypothetical protein
MREKQFLLLMGNDEDGASQFQLVNTDQIVRAGFEEGTLFLVMSDGQTIRIPNKEGKRAILDLLLAHSMTPDGQGTEEIRQRLLQED